MSWPRKIQKALINLPHLPGVYEMLNEDGETLYAGKAKNLKKRVQTYFRPSAHLGPRLKKMREKTKDITWTEVSSEGEALILESNIIKEKRPKFNILLRDDKNFAYFCITLAEDFPRILFTRRIVKDGSLYFGPKTSAASVRKTIDLLRDIFLFRSTHLEITEIKPGKVEVRNPGNIKYPCLNFHIGKCAAPCIGNISKIEYRERIDKAIRFLRGHVQETLKELEENMKSAAEKKQFEKAARIRDLYTAVQSISQRQIVSAPDELSADVLGGIQKFGRSFFHLFQIRDGKVISSETFSLPNSSDEDATEGLCAFLREHADRSADTPKNIVVSEKVFPSAERNVWEEFFTSKWNQNVKISLPQKGKRKKLLDLAEQNAMSYAMRNAASFIKHEEDIEKTLDTLQKKLGMKQFPKRIECYDISHLGGTETVGSMVVFQDGEAKNSEYRRFKLRSVEQGEIDDYKSMEEVLFRRLSHFPEELPEEYKIQKLRSKKDQEMVRVILKKQKQKTGKKIHIDEFLILKKEKEIAGVLQSQKEKKKDTEEIKFVWAEKGLACFLLKKFIETSESKKLFLDKNLSLRIPMEKLEQFGFADEAGKLVYKNIGKKKKAKDSLEKKPDLIVIDGGKGQLSSAYKILKKFPEVRRVALCSLAKKNEEVYVPGRSKPIAITKSSSEGKLLQRIRDEAHRFAVTYHKSLHQKSQQKSVLDDIAGVGPKTKKKLLNTFGSVHGIREASDKDLLRVVSHKILTILRRAL